MSTGLAGPVSAPAHSLLAGSPPNLGSHGALGSVGPSHVGVSALRYPSGQADPLDIGGQVSTSSATGIVVAEVHAERDQSPDDGSSTTSRQPSANAAAARLPPEGPSITKLLQSKPNTNVNAGKKPFMSHHHIALIYFVD